MTPQPPQEREEREEPILLPMIPEPTHLKDAVRAGIVTADELADAIVRGFAELDPDLEPSPEVP